MYGGAAVDIAVDRERAIELVMPRCPVVLPTTGVTRDVDPTMSAPREQYRYTSCNCRALPWFPTTSSAARSEHSRKPRLRLGLWS